jgi:hypothetical protein
MPLLEASAPKGRTIAVRGASRRATTAPFWSREFVAQKMHFRCGAPIALWAVVQ